MASRLQTDLIEMSFLQVNVHLSLNGLKNWKFSKLFNNFENFFFEFSVVVKCELT